MRSPSDPGWFVGRARGLLVCRKVLDSPISAAMLELLDSLQSGDEADALARRYATLFGLLADEAELATVDWPGNPWQRHLVHRLLADENPFSTKVRLAGLESVGPSLRSAMIHDLTVLSELCNIDAGTQATASGDVPSWAEFQPMPNARSLPPDELALAEALLRTTAWGDMLPRIADHYARHGAGLFGQFVAFRWVRHAVGDANGDRLEGIESPDPVQLSDLVGYDSERRLLVQNTRQFVAGFPANNVLLYGDRGTGKSSTVKALLHDFAGDGLRMIEVTKQGLDDFGHILQALRGRPEHFILFVDDLSFEEHESHYKELKAILEGSLEARPPNVVLYATSNRRHLITERFSDRVAPSDDEIRTQDTMQEKLSLSDRFGLTLTFLEPDQEQYLAIVDAMAARRGVHAAGDDLRRRALQWASWHNGRSGRTARQLIDHLVGEEALEGLR